MKLELRTRESMYRLIYIDQRDERLENLIEKRK